MVWNEELKREIPEGWGINYLDSFKKNKLGEIGEKIILKAVILKKLYALEVLIFLLFYEDHFRLQLDTFWKKILLKN